MESPASSDLKTYSKDLLEDLFNGHHYDAGGLRFIPPGTPTNNTSNSDADYSIFPDDVESFNYELLNEGYTVENEKKKKSDGQRLAEAFGINSNIFKTNLNGC